MFFFLLFFFFSFPSGFCFMSNIVPLLPSFLSKLQNIAVPKYKTNKKTIKKITFFTYKTQIPQNKKKQFQQPFLECKLKWSIVIIKLESKLSNRAIQTYNQGHLNVPNFFFQFWASVQNPWIWSPRGWPLLPFYGFFSKSIPLLVLRNKKLYPSE